MGRPISHFSARCKTADILALVKPRPIPHLSHTRPIRPVRRCPISHLCRPNPSHLTAQKLTRLSPISHRTRPFSHFWQRKPLKINPDMAPESESELNRTLEAKYTHTEQCGYVGKSCFNASLTLGQADANPLRGFAMPIRPHPPLALTRSLRRSYKRTIGIGRLTQRFKKSRSQIEAKLKSETISISAGNLLGEASKRVFWRKIDELWRASKVRFPAQTANTDGIDVRAPHPRSPQNSIRLVGSQKAKLCRRGFFARPDPSHFFAGSPPAPGSVLSGKCPKGQVGERAMV
jgi:hypothetical protein